MNCVENNNVVKLTVKFDSEFETGLPALKIFENGIDSELYIIPFNGYELRVVMKDCSGDYGKTDLLGFGNMITAMKNFESPQSNNPIFAGNDNGYSMFMKLLQALVFETLVKYSCNFVRYTRMGITAVVHNTVGMNMELLTFAEEVYKWVDQQINC